MVSEKMKPFMANNSAIRAMFEEGKKMAAVYGAENVYDFSLGNPNVPVPEVNEAILEIVKEEAFNASVARVRLYQGTGKITINDRDIDDKKLSLKQAAISLSCLPTSFPST